MKRWLYPIILLSLVLLGGCADNPVTGERQLFLMSEQREIEIGEQGYLPGRQRHGGDYVVDRDLTRYVQQVGRRLAMVADRQLPYEFVVVNDSTPNAWTLPGGKIAVNRGLLTELHNEAELAAVLSHEIVHAAARHGARNMERRLLLKGALMTAAIAAQANDIDNADLLLSAASVGAGLIGQKYSRDAELEADRYGMIYMQRAGYDPRAAVALQETFVRLAEGREENWLTALFASHPPSRERVQRNRTTARELAADGGRIGEEAYLRATGRLRRDRPAYAAYDEGRRLLSDSPRRALALAREAIAREPEEALFHELKGDALLALGKEERARLAYDDSIARNDDFYRSHLKRGLLLSRLQMDDWLSRMDLEQSLELLPTANAHLRLAQVLEQDGAVEEALKHYLVAARSDTEAGEQARLELPRLDIEQHPGRYLEVTLDRDDEDRLWFAITNPTSIPVRNLEVLVGKKNFLGIIYRGETLLLTEVIEPGETAEYRSPVKGVYADRKLRYYGVQILSAEKVE